MLFWPISTVLFIYFCLSLCPAFSKCITPECNVQSIGQLNPFPTNNCHTLYSPLAAILPAFLHQIYHCSPNAAMFNLWDYFNLCKKAFLQPRTTNANGILLSTIYQCKKALFLPLTTSEMGNHPHTEVSRNSYSY